MIGSTGRQSLELRLAERRRIR